MLSQTQVVDTRKAIERLYDGTCTVEEEQKYKRENGSTGFKPVVTLENEPCRLSFSKLTTANLNNGVSVVTQSVKLFISPDVVIKAGSKITVEQNGRSTEYKSSGQPAVFSTHQEIALELFEEWS